MAAEAAAEAAAVEAMHPQNTKEGAEEGPKLGNRLETHHLLAASKKVEMYKKEIICLYGYCADGNLPSWKNKENYIGALTPTEFLSCPTNIACHNLYKTNPMPQGTRRLLGLGLKFCTLCACPTNRINQTIERAKTDIRRMAFLKRTRPRSVRGY